MIKRIDAILISTPDFDRLVAFYRDIIGLRLNVGSHGDGLHADTDELGIHFAIWPKGPSPTAKGQVCIALLVDEIELEYGRLRELGVAFEHPPKLFPFGGTIAPFDDPDGNKITLIQFK